LISVKEYYDIRKSATSDPSWIWDRKAEAIDVHFQKVVWCDAILVLNYEKNGVADYVGANTLMEMGLAFYLKKKIFLLNPVPKIGSQEEILGMKSVVIARDLNQIK